MDKTSTSNSENTRSNSSADRSTMNTTSSAGNFNPNILVDRNENKLQEEVTISINSPGPSTRTVPIEAIVTVLNPSEPNTSRSITEFFSPRSSISSILHSSRSCEDITDNASKKRKVGSALINGESNPQIPSAANLRNRLFMTAIKQSSNNKYDKPVTQPSRWSDEIREIPPTSKFKIYGQTKEYNTNQNSEITVKNKSSSEHKPKNSKLTCVFPDL